VTTIAMLDRRLLDPVCEILDARALERTGTYCIREGMARRPFDLIAFDGDDTLWHNERSYRDGREQFRRLLAGAGVDLSADEVEAHVNRTELANLAFFGYGVSSFVLSLIETAIDLTGGRISGADLRGAIALAKDMLTEDIELFPSAHETLTTLAAKWPLMLITKGAKGTHSS
jgi:putative hydrolase of the HAD superfamily